MGFMLGLEEDRGNKGKWSKGNEGKMTTVGFPSEHNQSNQAYL